FRERHLRQYGAAQPDSGGGGDGPVGGDLLLARLRSGAHAHPRGAGAAAGSGARRGGCGGREDHRPRHDARALRGVRAHLLYDIAIRVGAAASARSVRRHRARRTSDSRRRQPVPAGAAVRRPEAARVLESYPGEHHHRLLHQLEQRDAPNQHRRSRGRAEDSTKIAGFVLPLGSTMCMNGTALYEGVTVLFLAQVFGVSLDLGTQIVVLVLSVITAVGAAGVPGGSLPLLMVVLATVGVPPEGIAVILGVDRILDMCRTTVNVCGDLTAAVYVARAEGEWDPRVVNGAVKLAPAA